VQYRPADVRRERLAAERVPLGAQHRFVNERMARDRRADGTVAVLDRVARRSVHVSADHHHSVVQHGAAELPQHHQPHHEFGERRAAA